DGANVTITDRAYIVRDETGNAIRMVGVMTDGSDFARVQEEKTALARLLEQTNRIASLGRLAATVAHEFNNVLMSIQPYAEVLQRKAGDAEVVRKSAAAIVQSVRRGTGITTEILRFARPVEPTLAPVALADWLERFAQDVAAMNMPKVEVRIEPPDPSVRVLADERQIEQLAINLVVNARDAMPDGGRITISAGSCAVCECPCDFLAHDQLPSCACLKFSDTGMGIPEEVMGKIFEPLFTTKRNGTGLGLAVGHQIATAHGGYLHARSEVGKGTTFFLVLRTP
ncbi:MAG TPA: ATP-binding protein, partial [Thermoanaerobaculia bacterium]|nr:ATP-binding protein [Thermoanaerobaculia bacterium]